MYTEQVYNIGKQWTMSIEPFTVEKPEWMRDGDWEKTMVHGC